MKERHGFVYIWMDRKQKRFYIGSHVGEIDDGYVCSSKTMRQAYDRRPQDFKRRILYTQIGDRASLLTEESRWLSFIKTEELGKRYYNKERKTFGSESEVYGEWSRRYWSDPTNREKKSRSMTGKKNPAHSERMRAKWADPEFKKKFNRSVSNKKAWANDEKRRERQREFMSSRKKTPEERDKIRAAHLKRFENDPEYYRERARLARSRRSTVKS